MIGTAAKKKKIRSEDAIYGVKFTKRYACVAHVNLPIMTLIRHAYTFVHINIF